MLKRGLGKLVGVAILPALVVVVAGCVSASDTRPVRKQPADQSYRTTLVWTGDDGLSYAFERAITNAVRENKSFRLSGYFDAQIFIKNTTNVMPTFKSGHVITGFAYHIVVYRLASKSGAKVVLLRADSTCKKDDVAHCATHIVNLIQARLAPGKGGL